MILFIEVNGAVDRDSFGNQALKKWESAAEGRTDPASPAPLLCLRHCQVALPSIAPKESRQAEGRDVRQNILACRSKKLRLKASAIIVFYKLKIT